jgi:hypothetical protein
MNDSHVLIYFYYLGILGIVAPGVDINPVPPVSKLAGKFPDINVHTPGVFGPQLTDGAGVNAEHGDL